MIRRAMVDIDWNYGINVPKCELSKPSSTWRNAGDGWKVPKN